jgi:hypothetical protein
VGKAAVNADVIGGAGNFSGAIISQGAVGTVKIFGSLGGGTGDESGTVQSHGRMAAVNITGSITGSLGDRSGAIIASEVLDENDLGVAGSIGAIVVGGNIMSGSGDDSGAVFADGNLASLSAASLVGGTVEAGRGILQKGNAVNLTFSGSIDNNEGDTATILVKGRIGTLSVADDVDTAVIRAGANISAIAITGDVTNTTVSAVGVPNPVALTGDLAIASIKIGGNATGSNILAGYDLEGVAVNADASIGTVNVKGQWIAGSIVAGVQDVDGDGFGDADDAKIAGGIDREPFFSQIASVIVKGGVSGTEGGTDQYAFTAERILKFKSLGLPLAFNTQADHQSFALGSTGDISAREI